QDPTDPPTETWVSLGGAITRTAAQRTACIPAGAGTERAPTHVIAAHPVFPGRSHRKVPSAMIDSFNKACLALAGAVSAGACTDASPAPVSTEGANVMGGASQQPVGAPAPTAPNSATKACLDVSHAVHPAAPFPVSGTIVGTYVVPSIDESQGSQS